jgi:hypothetical protein
MELKTTSGSASIAGGTSTIERMSGALATDGRLP